LLGAKLRRRVIGGALIAAGLGFALTALRAA
jgi:hypothetical protein